MTNLPNNYDLDRVFKIAGFPFGRPVATRPDRYVETGVNSWDILVSIFSDDEINRMVEIVGRYEAIPANNTDKYPVFDHLLAAQLLERITEAGYTPMGRDFATTNHSFGDVWETYEDGQTVRVNQYKTVTRLNDKARFLKGEIDVMTAVRTGLVTLDELTQEIRNRYADI